MRYKSRLALFLLALCGALLAACSTEVPAENPTLAKEGEPCAADDQCETKMCAALPGEAQSTCRRACEAGCKADEICTTLSVGAGGKLRTTCVPERAGLCVTCEYDGDCPYPADACIKLGDRLACGRDCAFDKTCPEGYRCAEAVSSSGDKVAFQCVPESGSCSCMPATVGQKRPCERTNEHGTCTGVEVCSEELAFTGCDAPEPAPEVCNLVDDDCDGETDEDIAEQVCGQGECLVTVPGCVEGTTPQCVPKAPGVETCNGKDDDCDGFVDNGFDLQTDPRNCGTCGNVCSASHATALCQGGHCALGSCEPGWGNCDGDASNGCETDTTSSLQHCGQCNRPCEWRPNTTASCESACVYECVEGWNDCNGQQSDGCESNRMVDLNNCGACGNKCPDRPNATTLCSQGLCSYACVGTWHDCDGLPENGCEANLQNDPNNCGGCNHVCPSPEHALATCSNASCRFDCALPYQDCNGQVSDGCETNVSGDVNNCGSCGSACPSGPHSTSGCSGSACTLTCDNGWGDCDGSGGTGCETNLNTFSAHAQCLNIEDLGEIDGDISPSQQIVRSGYGEAFFRVRIDEESGSSIYVSATVVLESPPGFDYDLRVYRGSCGANVSTSSSASSIDFVETCAPDGWGREDGYELWIEVTFYSGRGCAPWTLTIAGNTLVEACE